MSQTSDVIALHEIGAARDTHGFVEEILRQVIANRDTPDDQPAAGMVDIDFIRLDGARMKLSLLDPSKVEAMACPAAAASLLAFREAFEPVEDAYGRVCGLDRTHDQAASARGAMAVAAEEALGHLMAYWREVGGLEIPPLAAYADALKGIREAWGPIPPPAPRSPVPRVREPLDGSVTAPRARILLGRAFGTLAGLYLRSGAAPTRMTGAVACGDLAALSAFVGIRASRLSARMRSVDGDIGKELVEASEAMDALDATFMDAMAKDGIPVEALPDLRAKVLACAMGLGNRIRRVERIAALRGYDLAPAPEPDAPAPR